jgi:hypothetical protein
MPENKPEMKEYLVASPIMYKKKRYDLGALVKMETGFGDPLVEQKILQDLPETPEPTVKKAAKEKESAKTPDILDRDKK